MKRTVLLTAVVLVSVGGCAVLTTAALVGYLTIAVAIAAVLMLLVPAVRRSIRDLVFGVASRFPTDNMRLVHAYMTQQRAKPEFKRRMDTIGVPAACALVAVLAAALNMFNLSYMKHIDTFLGALPYILVGWGAPVAAIRLVRNPERDLQVLSYPLFFLPAYLWAWMLFHWQLAV